MDLSALTNETIQKVAQAILEETRNGLRKTAIDSTTGLTGYNLDKPAKLIVPLLAPFRQSVARVTRPGTGTNWRQIDTIAPGGTLLSTEGTKSAGWTMSKTDKSASYKPYGLLGDVTWEGVAAGGNFEDVRARAETLTLLQFLRREEAAILGGLAGTALGAGPTPTVVAATSGGSLADATYYVYLVPLSLPGVIGASRIARPTTGNAYDFTSVPTLSLLDGVGLPTAANTSATVTGGGGAGKLTVTWTWAAGVSAYAIYIGTSSGSTNAKLQGIVSQAEVVVTKTNTTGAVPNTADTSNKAPFDGIHQQLIASGSGATATNAGANPLSSAVGRGIPEIDAILNDIYDRVKEEPDRMVMGYQEHQSIDDAMAAVANDRLKFNIAISGNQSAEALPRFNSYKSSRGKVILMEENPNIAGGVIYFLKDMVEIPNSEIPNAWQMHMGQDLMRLDYALTDPKYLFEIRAYGALAGYAPSFQGVLYNIAKY